MGRQSEGWPRLEDIAKFPCKDLKLIDRLWVEASQSKFGFSVQKQIWRACGSPNDYDDAWEEFGDRVGWRNKGDWIYYNRLTFNDSAPQGHLPCCMWLGLSEWGFWFLVWFLFEESLLLRREL